MSVSQSRAAEVLAKCARHCSICRRFRPLHLQVHHIVEQNEGGTDDFDNLIAICVSCHSDVHTDTKLTRRFTEKELKLHRENVYQLVADGKLPSGSETEHPLETLSALIVNRLLSSATPEPVARLMLSPTAVEVLLAAVNENAPVTGTQIEGVICFSTGGQIFGSPFDLRSVALYRNAINQLFSANLIEGDQSQLYVSHQGYLVADDILSAGSQARTSDVPSDMPES